MDEGFIEECDFLRGNFLRLESLDQTCFAAPKELRTKGLWL